MTLTRALPVLTVMALSTVAYADVPVSQHRVDSGNVCQPIYGEQNRSTRDELGLGSIDSTYPLDLICPTHLELTYNESCVGTYTPTLYLHYKDGSTTDEFVCQFFKVSSSGTVTWGNPRWTCSTGACSDPTTSWTGTNTMAVPTLSVTGGCGDGTIYNFGVVCTMAKPGTGGTSYVRDYTSWL